MGYFNNPGTLDELDSQFNELLNQYEYRSGKNISTIDEIRTEYKKIKARMKKRLETVSKLEKSYDQTYAGRVVENYNTDLSAHGAGAGEVMPKAGSVQQPQQNGSYGQAAAHSDGYGQAAARNGEPGQAAARNGEPGQAAVQNGGPGQTERPADGLERKHPDVQSSGPNNYANESVRQSDYDWQKIFQTGEFAPKPQQSSMYAAAEHDGGKKMQSGEDRAVEGRKNVQSGEGRAVEGRRSVQNSVQAVKSSRRQGAIQEEDARSLLSECKEDITEIIRELSKDRTSDSYNMLEDIVFTYEDEDVMHWFNSHVDTLASRAKACRYDEVRAKLEREFRDAAQDKHTEAVYMQKIEKMIGAFIKKKFMEFEILYKDYEKEAEETADQAADRQLKMRGYILGIVMGALIFAIGCFFGLIGIVIGLICGVAAAIVIGRTYYTWRMPDEK